MSLTKVNYEMTEGDSLTVGEYTIGKKSPFGLVVRSTNTNTPSYLNVTPNGTIGAGNAVSLFRVYGTDVNADSTNYESCDFEAYSAANIGTTNEGYWIKTRKNGTGSHRPVSFQVGGAALLHFDPVNFGTTTSTNFYGNYVTDGCGQGDISIGMFGRGLRSTTESGTTTFALVFGAPGDQVGIGAANVNAYFVSGTQNLAGNLVGGTQVTINTDSVATITPPRLGGFANITCDGDKTSPAPDFTCPIYYDSGASLAIQKSSAFSSLGSLFDVTTSNVTGTTGTPGHVTVAVQSGVVKIENRSGSTLTFQVSFS